MQSPYSCQVLNDVSSNDFSGTRSPLEEKLGHIAANGFGKNTYVIKPDGTQYGRYSGDEAGLTEAIDAVLATLPEGAAPACEASTYTWHISKVNSGDIMQVADIIFKEDGAELDLSGCTVSTVLNGGTEGGSGGSETPDKLIDGNQNTKWLVKEFSSSAGASVSVACGSSFTPDAFTFRTANDAPDRDPIQWTMTWSNGPSHCATYHSQQVGAQTSDFYTPSTRKTIVTPDFELSQASAPSSGGGGTASTPSPTGTPSPTSEDAHNAWTWQASGGNTGGVSSSSSEGSDAGIIAAVVIGVLLFLGLVAAAAYYKTKAPGSGGGLASQDGNKEGAVTVDISQPGEEKKRVVKGENPFKQEAGYKNTAFSKNSMAPNAGKSVKGLAGRWEMHDA